MKVCIHRGTQEVGGTCIEVESAGKRIVLDVGLPLNAESSIRHLPKVRGFRTSDSSLLAVLLSHPHQDHYGLAHFLSPDIRIIMGAAGARMLKAAALFTPSGATFNRLTGIEDRKPLVVGPFTITPYLNDHSAYDAYSLLVAADGERLFYSGDFRGHGRKGALFERFLEHPPSDVDVLLMEGTTIGRSASEGKSKTEQELEQSFIEHIEGTKGMVLVWTSGQNIDRLVTIFKACRKAGRQLILDLYTAEILRATGNLKLPQATWNGVKVFLPASQKRQIKKMRRYDIVNRYADSRIYPEALADEAARSVMLFRPSMTKELERAECIEGSRVVYSLWSGYLKQEKQQPFLEWLTRHGIPLAHCHTSGHASPEDLRRFAKTVAPRMLVPIHSFEGRRFKDYFDHVEVKQDGQWWEVPRVGD
ncbi:MAG: MBL fold metallo-hydrolase [Nitrospirota bacterium]